MKASMKKLLTVGLCLVLALAVFAGCGDSQQGSSDGANENPNTDPGPETEGSTGGGDTVVIKFPTAATTGALYPLGAAITNLWTTEIDHVQAASEASNGGIDNLNLLADGEAQVSIAISSNCYESLNGEGTFEGRPNEDLRVIAGLYYNPNQVVVTADSGIESLADVSGKHFATGAAGSSTDGESKNHFEAAGLTYPDDIRAEYIGFTEAVDLMRNKQLDGAWIMAALGNAAVTESTATAGCKVLNIDDAIIEALQAEYPWYAKFTIPAGTYEGQDEDIQTTAIKMIMFTTADLDDDTVYELTKVFWENIDSLAASNSSLEGLTVEDALTDIAGLPLHDGAARYYQEIGIL